MGFLKRLFGRGDDEVVIGPPPDPSWSPPPADARVQDLPPPPGAGAGASYGRVVRTSRVIVDGNPGDPTTTTQVFVNGQPVEAGSADLGEFERLAGVDLDGDGRIAGGAPAERGLQSILDQAFASMPMLDGSHPADQRVALLERLAALRDSGAITPAEFEAEKARFFGS